MDKFKRIWAIVPTLVATSLAFNIATVHAAPSSTSTSNAAVTMSHFIAPNFNYDRELTANYLSKAYNPVKQADIGISTMDLRPVFDPDLNQNLAGNVTLVANGSFYKQLLNLSDSRAQQAWMREYFNYYTIYSNNPRYSYIIADKVENGQVASDAQLLAMFTTDDNRQLLTSSKSKNVYRDVTTGKLYLAPKANVVIEIVDYLGNTAPGNYQIYLTNRSNKPQEFATTLTSYMDLLMSYAEQRYALLTKDGHVDVQIEDSTISGQNITLKGQNVNISNSQLNADQVFIVEADNLSITQSSEQTKKLLARANEYAKLAQVKAEKQANKDFHEVTFVFPSIVSFPKVIHEILTTSRVLPNYPIVPLFVVGLAQNNDGSQFAPEKIDHAIRGLAAQVVEQAIADTPNTKLSLDTPTGNYLIDNFEVYVKREQQVLHNLMRMR